MPPKSKSSSSGTRPPVNEVKANQQRVDILKQSMLSSFGDDFPIDKFLSAASDAAARSRAAGKTNEECRADMWRAVREAGITPEQIEQFQQPVPPDEVGNLLPFMPEEFVKQLFDQPQMKDGIRLTYAQEMFEIPDIKAKGEKMRFLTKDYDPKSPDYKRDIRESFPAISIVTMDHIEKDAPFAVGLRMKWELKAAMWTMWGEIEEDKQALKIKHEDYVHRADSQGQQCLLLYEKHGARAPSHTKFHDTYHAYLYLTARATTHRHLLILRLWHEYLTLATIQADEIFNIIHRSKRGNISQIASCIEYASGDEERGDMCYKEKYDENDGDNLLIQHLQAAAHYIPGLAQLAPWLAMDWYMMPSEDTQGLSQVEITLNLKLAECAMAHEQPFLATLHIQAVLQNPFATNAQLSQASSCYIRVLKYTVVQPQFPLARRSQYLDWIWNAKVLAAVAKHRPAKGKWQVQYTEYSLEEKIRRLRGLGAIMPLLFGVARVSTQ